MTGRAGGAAAVAAGLARQMGPWSTTGRVRVRGEDARVGSIVDYRR